MVNVFMLSVIMLNVFMLTVFMLNVFMLNVMAPKMIVENFSLSCCYVFVFPPCPPIMGKTMTGLLENLNVFFLSLSQAVQQSRYTQKRFTNFLSCCVSFS
jgi:hypothetical protein